MLALLATASGTYAGAESQSAPARIIDRTIVCRVSGIGYPDSVRFLRLSVSPYDPSVDVAPEMSVSEGAVGTPGWGAYVRTGPAGDRQQDQEPTGQVTLPRIAVGRCANTRLRIRLSSKGLRPGPSGQGRTAYRCDVPAKVLVRVRAIFKRPTTFRVDPRFRDHENAKGNITIGYLAVTTLRGRKPLGFASVQDAGGKARVFVARSGCAREQ
jgi:hypothetical protein